MKPTLALITLLMLVATPAWAEWVKVSVHDELDFYIDPATIRKDGNLRRVWSLNDLKVRNDSTGELSLRYLSEFDCKEGRWRILDGSTHSGHMATGKVLVPILPPSIWTYTPPDTALEHQLKFVCAQ